MYINIIKISSQEENYKEKLNINVVGKLLKLKACKASSSNGL